jgi:hypothetical protein
MNEQNSIYFSIFGGYIYEASPEEEKMLDAFQIPLISKPDNSCKKCHGRFHVGFDIDQKHFIICKSCSKKLLDVKKILSKKGGKK